MRVTYFILEQGEHSYSCSLVPRPTCSFDCLQCVKQIMTSYPGPGYNSPIPNHCPPQNICLCRNSGVLICCYCCKHICTCESVYSNFNVYIRLGIKLYVKWVPKSEVQTSMYSSHVQAIFIQDQLVTEHQR